MVKKNVLNIVFVALASVFLLISLYFWRFSNLGFSIFSAIVSLSLWIAFFVENRALLKMFLFSRQGKKGIFSLFNSLFLLLIFFLFYLLFFFNVLHFRVDLTPKSVFTLSNKTKALLKNLDKDVKIVLFSAQKDENDYQYKILNAFKNESGRIEIEVLNPFRNPVLAQTYGVNEQGALVILSEGQKPILLKVQDFFYDDAENATKVLFVEKKLALAINKIMNPVQKKVGFYGEKGSRKISDAKANGLSEFARDLTLENLNLLELGLEDFSALKDLDLLVIVGPKDDFSPKEISNLDQFLKEGKPLVLLYDPVVDNGGKSFANLEAWSKKYGVVFENDLVIDPNDHLQTIGNKKGAPFEPSAVLSDHEALKPLKEDRYKPYLFTARSITYLENARSGSFRFLKLLSSSNQAYGKKDFRDRTLSYDPKVDIAGPLNLVVALENIESKQRLIFGGDSAFISNYMRFIASNKEVFKNILLWSLGEENFEREEKRIEEPIINASLSTQIASFLAFVVIIPILFLVCGVIVYFYRGKNNV